MPSILSKTLGCYSEAKPYPQLVTQFNEIDAIRDPIKGRNFEAFQTMLKGKFKDDFSSRDASLHAMYQDSDSSDYGTAEDEVIAALAALELREKVSETAQDHRLSSEHPFDVAATVENMYAMQGILPSIADDLERRCYVQIPLDNRGNRPHVQTHIEGPKGQKYSTTALLDTGSAYTIITENYILARRKDTGEALPISPTKVKLSAHMGHTVPLVGECTLSLFVKDQLGKTWPLNYVKCLVTRDVRAPETMDDSFIIIGMIALASREARLECVIVGDKPQLNQYHFRHALHLPKDIMINQDRYAHVLAGEPTIQLGEMQLCPTGQQIIRPMSSTLVEVELKPNDSDDAMLLPSEIEHLDVLCHIQTPGMDTEIAEVHQFNWGIGHISVPNITNDHLDLSQLEIGTAFDCSESSDVNAVDLTEIANLATKLSEARYIEENSSCFCETSYARETCVIFLKDQWGRTKFPNLTQTWVEERISSPDMSWTKLPEGGTQMFLSNVRRVNGKRFKNNIKKMHNIKRVVFAVPPELLNLRETSAIMKQVSHLQEMGLPASLVCFQKMCKDHTNAILPASEGYWIHVRYDSQFSKAKGAVVADNDVQKSCQIYGGKLVWKVKGLWTKMEYRVDKEMRMNADFLRRAVRSLFQCLMLVKPTWPICITTLADSNSFGIQDALGRDIGKMPLKRCCVQDIPQQLIPQGMKLYDPFEDDNWIKLDTIQPSEDDPNLELCHLEAIEDYLINGEFDFIGPAPKEETDVKRVTAIGKKYDKKLKNDPKFHQWMRDQEDIMPKHPQGHGAYEDPADSETSSKLGEEVQLNAPVKGKDVPWRECGWEFPKDLNEADVQFYSDIFDLRHDVVDPTENIVEIKVTPRNIPFKEKPWGVNKTYPVKSNLREPLRRVLEAMAESGIFREILSPSIVMPAMALLKPQRIKGLTRSEIETALKERPVDMLRVVVDTRGVAAFLKKMFETIPKIQDLILKLPGNTVITSLDMRSFFSSIPIDQASQEVCVIGLLGRFWQYARLLQGFAPAPSLAQQVMNEICSVLDPDSHFSYIDDVFLLGKNTKELQKTTARFLERAQEMRLRISIQKMQLQRSKDVQILGYSFSINDNGLFTYVPCTTKTQVFPATRTSVSKHDLWRFTGTANFFLSFLEPSYQMMLVPLYAIIGRLAHEDARTIVEMDELEQLSWKLCVAGLEDIHRLHIPTPEARCEILVDSSLYGVGCVAFAYYEDTGERHIIMNYAKAFSKSQTQANSAYALEFLGALQVLRKLEPFLHHCRSARLYVDCKSIIYGILRAQNSCDVQAMNSLAARYVLKMSSYVNVDFYHVPRNQAAYADLLSKLGVDEPVLKHKHINISHFHKIKYHQLDPPLTTGAVYELADLHKIIEDCEKERIEIIKPLTKDDQDSVGETPDCKHSFCQHAPLYPECINTCPEKLKALNNGSCCEKAEPISLLNTEIDDTGWTEEEPPEISESDDEPWSPAEACEEVGQEDLTKLEALFPVLRDMQSQSRLEAIEATYIAPLDTENSSAASSEESDPILVRSPFQKLGFASILDAQLEDEEYSRIITTFQTTPKEDIPLSIRKKYALIGNQLLAVRTKPRKQGRPIILRPVVPRPASTMLVAISHLSWNHAGQAKLLTLLAKSFYVEDISYLVKTITKACDSCLRYKYPIMGHKYPGNVYADSPLDTMFMDFLYMPKKRVNGVTYKYILLITDAYSGLNVAYPTSNMTHTTVRTKLTNLLSLCRPKKLLSDRQTSLLKHKKIRSLCRSFGCKAEVLRPFAKVANISEPENRLMRTTLRLLTNASDRKWPELVAHASYLLSTTPRRIRGFKELVSPWEVVFKRANPDLNVWNEMGASQRTQTKIMNSINKSLKAHLKLRHKTMNELADVKKAVSSVQVGTTCYIKKSQQDAHDKQDSPLRAGAYIVTKRMHHSVTLSPVSNPRKSIERGLEYIVPIGFITESLNNDLTPSIRQLLKPHVYRQSNASSTSRGRSSDSSSNGDDSNPAHRDDAPNQFSHPPQGRPPSQGAASDLQLAGPRHNAQPTPDTAPSETQRPSLPTGSRMSGPTLDDDLTQAPSRSSITPPRAARNNTTDESNPNRAATEHRGRQAIRPQRQPHNISPSATRHNSDFPGYPDNSRNTGSDNRNQGLPQGRIPTARRIQSWLDHRPSDPDPPGPPQYRIARRSPSPRATPRNPIRGRDTPGGARQRPGRLVKGVIDYKQFAKTGNK